MGKALEAYTVMDKERSTSYEDPKEVLLEKSDISQETYSQGFREITTPPGETPNKAYNCLKGLYHYLTWPDEHTKEEISELIIILEELLHVLPYDVRTWVKEHEVGNELAVAKLALKYLNAHQRSLQQPHATPRTSRDPRDNGGNPVGFGGVEGTVPVIWAEGWFVFIVSS